MTFCGIGGSNLPLISLFQEKGPWCRRGTARTREALGKTGTIWRPAALPCISGETYLQNLDEDIIFRTPGMKFTLPELDAARARGAAVTSEMELFFDLCPCKIYAVTGSDGKTTTTTIVSGIFKGGREKGPSGRKHRPAAPGD